uniref:Uncharacterized protein n=1 Tax=Trichobilharzia regenti TaxID=157069 RepID=A0AA85KCS6_TRIRE|nr:unnamed protein product [Trichobilharzia regenti]
MVVGGYQHHLGLLCVHLESCLHCLSTSHLPVYWSSSACLPVSLPVCVCVCDIEHKSNRPHTESRTSRDFLMLVQRISVFSLPRTVSRNQLVSDIIYNHNYTKWFYLRNTYIEGMMYTCVTYSTI